MAKLAPSPADLVDRQLGAYYIERVKAALDGSWKAGDVWGGLAANLLVMAPYANMPPEVAAEAKAAEDGSGAARSLIFRGRSRTRPARVKVAAGAALDDGAIAGMNWLAEGVEGKLPS